MNYITNNFNFNKIIHRKNTKNYQNYRKIKTFLKSNYKYKRRSLRKTVSVQTLDHKPSSHWLQTEEEHHIAKRFIIIYDSINFEGVLRILILITRMQESELATIMKCCMAKNKNIGNSLTTATLFAKIKTNKIFNTSTLALLNSNTDGISEDSYAFKDANRDADNDKNINSNTAKEIRNQRHNYDKVSTITLTPIKCQRLKHQQIKSTKTFILSLIAPSTSLTAMMTTSLSSLSMVIARKKNYEILQWPEMLNNYICESLSIQHKHKHKQHIHFHQQHQESYQRQQHALPIKPFSTSRNLLSESNKINESNKHNSISINKEKISYSNIKTSTTEDVPKTTTTCNRVAAVYQSDEQYFNATFNRSCTLSCLLLALFIVFTIGVRSTTAGACWQTVLENGKCNEIFSLNISKSECCGANQEFAYTEREPTNVEYFFATAIGGGMECSPCLENCKNVKCGPNKKCVKRKGRPKCICAPECGAVRRRRKQQEEKNQQHHSFDLISSSIAKDGSDSNNEDDDDDDTATIRTSKLFKIKIDKSQQSRDIRSLSSEITNVNLGLESGKGVMMIDSGGGTSQMARHHINNKEQNENQRKFIQMHTQRNTYTHNTKEPNDFQLYTHQIQHQQQQPQHQMQIKQQQPKHKDQEPKGSRRLLITASVERTEKPTTIRLQIFSNVKATHARRHNNNNNNKNNKNNRNSKKNKNKNKNRNRNKHDQNEDSDPSDSNDDEQQYKEFGYNDAEENDDCIEAKRKYGNSDNNNNNRNDDATIFLNQSMSRHKLKTIIKSSNNNDNNSSSSSSSSNNNKNKNQKIRIKLKKNHNLQTTNIPQLHITTNNTARLRHLQMNGHHAVSVDTIHDSHQQKNHNHHQRQQEHHKHQHRHQQEQHHHKQSNHHHKHHQHRQNHHRHHDRQNSNKKQHQQQQQQQQSIVVERPKNNRDYNASIAILKSTAFNASDVKNLQPFTTQLQTKITITPLPNLATSSSSSYQPSSSEEVVTATTIITTPNQQSQSQLLCSSTTMFPLSSATPVNFTMSAINTSTRAISDAAKDHIHSHLLNHGSEIATSSAQPSLLTSSSDLKFPASASVLTASEGEGVTQYEHQQRRIQMPAFENHHHNNNNNNNNNSRNNKNADQLISTLNSNLHNNQQQQQQQPQQHNEQIQSHQQYFHSSLFDANFDQIHLMDIANKQRHSLTKTDNVRPLNPVCGTDGRTYNTECQLRKRACRTDNPNLQIAYRGHCKTTCNGVKCLNGLTCVEDQYSLPHCISCKIECLQDDYDNDVDATKAVCGADGKTYKSVCDINRMICKIGRSIGVAYLGPCHEDQITCDDINCGRKQVCLIDLLTHKPRCTSCRYKCSRKRSPLFTHLAENKICGNNNRTYNSWCEMRKDSCSTGFYIDLKYSGNCH